MSGGRATILSVVDLVPPGFKTLGKAIFVLVGLARTVTDGPGRAEIERGDLIAR